MRTHSEYLVRTLENRPDENLFNFVKFRLVARALRSCVPAIGPGAGRPLRILDLGCGTRVAERYLGRLGLPFLYCGVDYEAAFGPDVVADLRDPEQIRRQLPWQPDVILALDVLEHLDGREADVRKVLRTMSHLLDDSGRVVITVPQMYRLDCFKLPHLTYPEHKVRLTAREWHELLDEGLEVRNVQGVGFISTLPYLLMAHPGYRDEAPVGAMFKRLRDRTLERAPLRVVDYGLSRAIGPRRVLKRMANDLMFVCRPRGSAS